MKVLVDTHCWLWFLMTPAMRERAAWLRLVCATWYRIDAPGALHHMIARGIERRAMFRDDHDRQAFVERLATLVRDTQTRVFPWAACSRIT